MCLRTKQPCLLSGSKSLFNGASTTTYWTRRSHSRSPYADASVPEVPPVPIRALSSADRMPSSNPPLSILPLSTLIRSFLTTGVSSSPLLLRPAMSILSVLAHSRSGFLDPDRNPVLHYLLKKTFYAQFCAGETREEIKVTMSELKGLGYKGVILCYAKEVVLESDEEIKEKSGATRDAAGEYREVELWKKGTLDTISMTGEGDFVALKFTGAGQKALDRLLKALPPDPCLEQAITDICDLAAERKVRLLFDAEQHAVQPGIDAWTLDFQQRYNSRAPGEAVVYGTYQAYLKATPTVLAEHLAIARKHRFTLGVKLVRGAYLGSDPRHVIWPTKEDTDRTFDEIAESLIRRTYGEAFEELRAKGENEFPDVNLVLASHNHVSVKKAQIIRNEQVQKGQGRVDMVYGQLMGMADELSCELLQEGQTMPQGVEQMKIVSAAVDRPRVYKYLVWGTVGECMKYLLRRAEENRDAVARTKEGLRALSAELGRRIRASFRRT